MRQALDVVYSLGLNADEPTDHLSLPPPSDLSPGEFCSITVTNTPPAPKYPSDLDEASDEEDGDIWDPDPSINLDKKYHTKLPEHIRLLQAAREEKRDHGATV